MYVLCKLKEDMRSEDGDIFLGVDVGSPAAEQPCEQLSLGNYVVLGSEYRP